MEKGVALITGATGQDGSYLSEFLLEKGYEVYAMVRRTSQPFRGRDLINHLMDNESYHLVNGDLTDQNSLNNMVSTIQPTEFYNLAAQSFVPESWKSPISTADITALGALRCLEAIKLHAPSCKYYQAGSSEQFGKVVEVPQNEDTPFYARSPYGCAKVFAHDITRNYRESYDLFACTGILFNHESPRRGIEFVTRKVSLSVARIANGLQDHIEIGNVLAKRDWGFAGDYIEAMWLMLQQDEPQDLVVATGKTWSVKEMIDIAFGAIGMDIKWEGSGVETIACDEDGNIRVKTSESFFRPAEVDLLVGDYSKAKESLGWEPKTSFEELINMMVESDMKKTIDAVGSGISVPKTE
jgi:GDPmannose 4,6-dehydratase